MRKRKADEDPEVQAFRAALRRAKKEIGTAEELGQACGLNGKTLGSFLAGGAMSYKKMRQAARALGTSVEAMVAEGLALLSPEKLDAQDVQPSPPSDFYPIALRSDMRVGAGVGETEEGFYDAAPTPIYLHKSLISQRLAKESVAFIVGGDSMAPAIAENSIVIVDISPAAVGGIKNGGVYLLRLNGEPQVKRLEWVQPGRLLAVLSDNPSYGRKYLPAHEAQILGRVLFSLADHR